MRLCTPQSAIVTFHIHKKTLQKVIDNFIFCTHIRRLFLMDFFIVDVVLWKSRRLRMRFVYAFFHSSKYVRDFKSVDL